MSIQTAKIPAQPAATNGRDLVNWGSNRKFQINARALGGRIDQLANGKNCAGLLELAKLLAKQEYATELPGRVQKQIEFLTNIYRMLWDAGKKSECNELEMAIRNSHPTWDMESPKPTEFKRFRF